MVNTAIDLYFLSLSSSILNFLLLPLYCIFISQLIFLNRLLVIAYVHLGLWVSTVNMLVHQTALVKTVLTNAVVPPRHLSAVTR